jgi:hypothetical protein
MTSKEVTTVPRTNAHRFISRRLPKPPKREYNRPPRGETKIDADDWLDPRRARYAPAPLTLPRLKFMEGWQDGGANNVGDWP